MTKRMIYFSLQYMSPFTDRICRNPWTYPLMTSFSDWIDRNWRFPRLYATFFPIILIARTNNKPPVSTMATPGGDIKNNMTTIVRITTISEKIVVELSKKSLIFPGALMTAYSISPRR